jgi:hypothetical protein
MSSPSARPACGRWCARLSELRLEVVEFLGSLAELGVRRPLADASQHPADGVRAVSRDARGDKRVQRPQVDRSEPGHHRGEVALALGQIGRGAADPSSDRAFELGVVVDDELELEQPGGGDLTAVMARLGPEDLETLDALITAGVAANRSDSVRWALARIRERPAFAKLTEWVRGLDELKAQF